MGVVTRTFPNDDDLVRKTEIREWKPTLYVRPITELVLLVSDYTLGSISVVCGV